MPDSDSPQQRMSRLASTPPPPASATRKGMTCSSSMGSISWGTPGRAKTQAPPTFRRRPGAVPRALGRSTAPCGYSAWRRLRGRHLPAPPPGPQLAQVGGELLAVGHLHPGGGADRLPGEVVLGGAQAAGDDDRVGPAHRLR